VDIRTQIKEKAGGSEPFGQVKTLSSSWAYVTIIWWVSVFDEKKISIKRKFKRKINIVPRQCQISRHNSNKIRTFVSKYYVQSKDFLVGANLLLCVRIIIKNLKKINLFCIVIKSTAHVGWQQRYGSFFSHLFLSILLCLAIVTLGFLVFYRPAVVVPVNYVWVICYDDESYFTYLVALP
jgi:hypothetical protein